MRAWGAFCVVLLASGSAHAAQGAIHFVVVGSKIVIRGERGKTTGRRGGLRNQIFSLQGPNGEIAQSKPALDFTAAKPGTWMHTAWISRGNAGSLQSGLEVFSRSNVRLE